MGVFGRQVDAACAFRRRCPSSTGAASRPRGARVVPALGAALAVLVAMFSSAGGAAAARGSAAVATADHAGNYARSGPDEKHLQSAHCQGRGGAQSRAPNAGRSRIAGEQESRARPDSAPRVASQLLAGASSAGAGTISGVKFQGMANSASICPYFGGCQPPDMALAASPKYVLQGVNTSYEIFKTNGTPWIGPINDLTWYGVPPLPGNCDPLGPFMSDPRAFYDPNTGLFWTATLQVEAAAFGVGSSCPNTSIYWVAVVNPATGVQHVYHFDMTLGGTVNAGADYTQFGFSGKTISFTGNMFDFTTGNYDFAEVQFADKATMEAGNPVTSVAFTDLTVGSVPVDTVQPVETEDDFRRTTRVSSTWSTRSTSSGTRSGMTASSRRAMGSSCGRTTRATRRSAGTWQIRPSAARRTRLHPMLTSPAACSASKRSTLESRARRSTASGEVNL